MQVLRQDTDRELYRCKCTSKEPVDEGEAGKAVVVNFYCNDCTDQQCFECSSVDLFERDTGSEEKLSKENVYCLREGCKGFKFPFGKISAHIELHDT